MQTVAANPARTLTVDDLYALGSDVRAELIHGEIVYKALPQIRHSVDQGSLIGWLHRRFSRRNAGRWPGGWWILPEIHTVYEETEVFCHDIAGWRRERMATAEPGWARLRPDWVCEILSPGHEKRDRVDKMGVLHRAGVPYYWLLDHVERYVEVYRHEPSGYLQIASASNGQTTRLAPFEQAELRMGVIFGDEDDEE